MAIGLAIEELTVLAGETSSHVGVSILEKEPAPLFTVNAEVGEGFVDWEWVESQPTRARRGLVRYLRFDEPMVVKMNGKRNQGIVYKPGRAPG